MALILISFSGAVSEGFFILTYLSVVLDIYESSFVFIEKILEREYRWWINKRQVFKY